MTLFQPDAGTAPRSMGAAPLDRSVQRTFIGGFETTFLPAADIDVGEVTGVAAHWGKHLDALQAAGVDRVRYPVRWHRIGQRAGALDWSQTDAELAELRRRGIEPIVDLVHHTSYPRRLSGGFADPGFAEELVAFVTAVAERYPWIPAYTVFNEPFATLFLAGHQALWPPFHSGMAGFTRLAVAVLPAVTAAWRAIAERLPAAEHVWIDTCESHEGTAGSPARYAQLANDRRHLLLDLVLGHDLDERRPALAAVIEHGGASLLDLEPVRVDALGLDYYPHSEWWYTEQGGHAPSPVPRGFAAVAEDYHRRYGLPMLLAETNVRGFPSDRATWLKYMVEQYEQAVAAGLPLCGFTWFPMLDSSDWDSLLALPLRHRDPVGVYDLDPAGRPRSTEFTAAWRLAAAGAPADELPAYRLQTPCDTTLRGFFSDVTWSWQEPPQPEPPIIAQAVVRDLVVLSHLRWDWVWQRPQHLVTRIARDRGQRGGRTWFVEEPIAADVVGPELWSDQVGQVTRVRLVVPLAGAEGASAIGFDHAAAAPYAALLRRLLSEEGVPHPDVLAYTPMALDLATALEPHRIAYDVMDDLASFAKAPAGMRRRQQELLACADVVFAGGRTLHSGVVGARPDCHLFPSGVDVAHYASSRGLRRTAGSASPERPIAGYVGVIDERLDLGLIADVARALPDWTIRMVGPLAKIDAADLPTAPNIEYTGMADYAELPAVMAAFDVALMPFACNDATRSISPTKTLEYLAAGLPVVSTPIADVVADYSEVVCIEESAQDFADACRRIHHDDAGARDHLVRTIGEHQSWDAIAASISALLEAPAWRTAIGTDDPSHRNATLAAAEGLQDAALGGARLAGPLVHTLADAAVASATPFVRAPLLARLAEVKRLHPHAGDATGRCPVCTVTAPCPTAVACA
jgi:glycosyltransferase involved in cell wall biosynthesis/beta-glucosidase/6-phospho-beta-glucosidase/beta-galactosidase